MPSFGTWLIFPEYILEGTSGGEEWLTQITATVGAEARDARWVDGRARINLSGAAMTLAQHKEWIAFRRALKGMWEPFLFRDVRECKLEDENGHPCAIGTGDGAALSFQLVKTFTYQGRATSRIVTKPDENYPPRLLPGGVQWWPLNNAASNYISVYVDDVLQTRTTDYTINRDTGIVTFTSAPADDAIISASGWFYTLMRFDSDLIQTEPQGGGVFVIKSGGLVEPKGGK